MTSRSASRRAREANPSPPPARKPPVIPLALGALALIVVIGLIIAFAGGDGGDDAEDVDAGASSPAVTGGSGGSETDSTSSGDPDDAAFGEVTVDGDPLPTFAATEGDPAIGETPPSLAGRSLDGTPTSVGGGPGEPTIVAFLAHWCPHCQAELPLLVAEAEDGTFDGVRMVAVLTGTDPDFPNFPPGAWLRREGWTGEVILDDRNVSASRAWGLSSYPYLVVLDASGAVVERASGEMPGSQLAELAAAAKGR